MPILNIGSHQLSSGPAKCRRTAARGRLARGGSDGRRRVGLRVVLGDVELLGISQVALHRPISGVRPRFEMPLLGYGGYLPFGLEVYAAYHFLTSLVGWAPRDQSGDR